MLGNYNDGLLLLMTASGSGDMFFQSIFREYMEISGIDPLHEAPAMGDFAENYLKPLEAKADLMETATIWVQTGGDLVQTADRLDCHPNTVRYRINRIRELTEPRSTVTDFQLYERLSAALKVRKLNE